MLSLFQFFATSTNIHTGGPTKETSLNYKNLTTKVGQNKDLVLLQEKVVIQAMCVKTQAVSIKARLYALKGGLWVLRKSQKISTASDQYFLNFVKIKL